MLKMTYKVESAEALAMLERAPEKIGEAIARGLDLALALFHNLVVTNIQQPHGQKPPAIAFGYLVNAIGTVHDEPLYGEVIVNPPADVYGAAVEYGTVPHFPPVAPLIRWVEKKFGTHLSAGEQKSVAYAIARTIAKRGTAGHFMFQRAFEQGRERAETLLDQALDEALAQLQET